MAQIMLVTALCLDAFAASLAYAVNKTKIPLSSMTVISFICTIVLTVSLGIGSAVKQIIPADITGIICFIILFGIGIIKCFECFLKRFISKNLKKTKSINLKLFDIDFVLTVYADNIKADSDNSKVLSSKEAIYLALALSLDGFAAGFGFGLTEFSYLQMILLSFVSNIIAVSLGYVFGKLLTKVTDKDFSWLGGAILIILAFTKLR